MFDMSKLGDMTKLAAQAKKMQAEQDRKQREQDDHLREISRKLDKVLALLNERR